MGCHTVAKVLRLCNLEEPIDGFQSVIGDVMDDDLGFQWVPNLVFGLDRLIDMQID